ncbi:MAG: dienelactone hydrolase family protein [Acidobacteria bacterium]|nr:dienelactone hydrolase family protein [Acidobacteriota bacterium]
MLLLFFAAGAAAQDKVTREMFAYAGRQREFFLYVPDTVRSDSPAPLLVALHGSGRDGASLVNPWKGLARKEGIIVVGPNAFDKAMWDFKTEGPDFFEALVNAISAKHPVDSRRMYLFGHSAGAIQSLMIGLLEAEYFAAVAVHAGALPKESWDLIDHADRKIPMAIWVGTNDRFFPLAAVSATKTALEAKGIPVHVRPISNHDHNYYQRSGDVNLEAWTFLKAFKLDSEPKFKRYETK